MLLFLMGVDIPSIVVLLFLLLLFGLLIFRLTRWLLRKTMKNTSDANINLLSRLCAFILSPLIVIGSFVLPLYISMQSIPTLSNEEIVSNHYQLMESELPNEFKVGMSKADVVKVFNGGDTTQSVMIYDLTVPEASEKYILEIRFENGKLTGFQRQR